jgi:hypothetical protein
MNGVDLKKIGLLRSVSQYRRSGWFWVARGTGVLMAGLIDPNKAASSIVSENRC